jgi:hypothetical protein
LKIETLQEKMKNLELEAEIRALKVNVLFLGGEAERSTTGRNGKERGLVLKPHYYQRTNYVKNKNY